MYLKHGSKLTWPNLVQFFSIPPEFDFTWTRLNSTQPRPNLSERLYFKSEIGL